MTGPGPHRPPSGRSARRTFFWAWAVLFALTALWSLATPISASPDEPAHMVKAASVVRGEFVGTWNRTGHRVEVPDYVADTHGRTCYAFDDSKTADCVPPEDGTDELVESSTTAGLYNPSYYLLVGWPTLILPDDSGIYAMRLVSGLLFSALLAASIALLSQWRRPLLPVLGGIAAVTPMVLFLGSAVNPNGFEVAAVLAVFVGMLTVTLERPERIVAPAAVVAVSAFIGLQSRGLSPLWVALAILIPLVMLDRAAFAALLRRKAVLISGAVVLVGAICAIVWTLASGSLSVVTVNAEEGFAYPGTGAPPIAGFTYVIEHTFEFGEGLIGVFGWLDTSAPLAVYFLWSTLVGMLALAAATLLRRRGLVCAIALAAAVLLMPALVQAAYITNGGLIWQGRYNLPMFVCLVVGLACLVAARMPDLDPARATVRRFVIVLTVSIAAAQFFAFATALRRYAVGIDGAWAAVIRSPDWSAPGGNLLLLAAYALVAAAGAFALHRLLVSRASPRTPEVRPA